MKLASSLFALAFAATAQAAAPLKTEVVTASPAGFLVTSTLITGEKEAVLVDAQFTLSEAHRLVAKVLESGKTLKTILITHGHPDHYFGLEVVRAAFPQAKVVATPAVIKEMKAHAPAQLAQWKPMYGSNLTSKPVFPSALTADALELEGQRLELINVNGGESEAGTAVWIPSTQTLIASDAAYQQVHAYLVGVDAARRAQWLKNIEQLDKRGATTVIPATGQQPPPRRARRPWPRRRPTSATSRPRSPRPRTWMA
ncbi:MBL fold metallo-hydrolase [Archangium gephyra]|uniref:MBL fold metallo-hydrolase n=1 Tax=Archangium gephyra TaxID=48 RepID=UPI003B812716